MITWDFAGTYQPSKSLISTATFSLNPAAVRLTASSEYTQVLQDYCYFRPLYKSLPSDFCGRWIRYYPSVRPLILPSPFDPNLSSLEKGFQIIQRLAGKGKYLEPILWSLTIELLRTS